MEALVFSQSAAFTLGVELELQIIDPHSYGLTSRAKDLIRSFRDSRFKIQIKPEITQSMIEINSSIHSSASSLLEELELIRRFLTQISSMNHVKLCGGGTHPFQKWTMQKIFPSLRYKKLLKNYQYLSKRSTVFGQHIHIGCPDSESAIYLTHLLGRYVPHFIAICASSPFYQGIDTGFNSSRATVFSAYPSSGTMPYLENWEEFQAYYYKMENLGIIETMKDFYWDIRPKPEFGTVEIRVCDTPLNISRAIIIAAYIQAIAMYLLRERPYEISKEFYDVYNYNRFQASRYGFEGQIINPITLEKISIGHDILDTIKIIERYDNELNSMSYIVQLANDVINKQNDALVLRHLLKQHNSYLKVVEEQCQIWLDGMA